ncbi:DUF2332 domain-containing protein [uncultured Nocardioides sp.]|uniref:DUF2332 domain-containing protein n=1 Tax=uncultured Nocardioides sp. TaxID=198441 RepID=UPI0026393BF8|nr:DUF2332 domain-containing protein [uncultured Nocardioides sp.]
MELFGGTRQTYAEFATQATDSPTFVAWTLGVVDDPEVLAWLDTLPAVKRQPNLVFAAARWHGLPDDATYADLREVLLGDDGSVRATIRSRATQTNEAGRLATLLPLLRRVSVEDGPIALVEVGASGGLTLHPDRWSYRYRTPEGELRVGDPGAPTLDCVAEGPGPWPDGLPQVAWRGGIDLNPLDVTDPDTARWLEVLVWPEHDDRRALLRRAIEVARQDPPHLVRGDLLTDLDPLLDEAAEHGRVVVQHSAVIAYLEREDRERFTDQMLARVAEGRCRWISNEGSRVLPRVSATGPAAPADRFVLALDGRAVAWTHGHGRSLFWVG